MSIPIGCMSPNQSEVTPALWELAHEDGSSIFVSELNSDTTKGLTIGPFLFWTFGQLHSYQGTAGPLNLLGTVDTPMQAQQVDLAWILENVREGFIPDEPDCIIIDDMLIPLTKVGARAADGCIQEDVSLPWTSMFNRYGPEFMRAHTAGIVQGMVTPDEDV